MNRDEWRKTIFSSCMENGTCDIYDQAAAWCRLNPGTVRWCGYDVCPWVLTSYLCTVIPGLQHGVI